MPRTLIATLILLLLHMVDAGQAQSPGRRPPDNSFNNRNPTQQRRAPAPAPSRKVQPGFAPNPPYNGGYGWPYGGPAYGPSYGPNYGPRYYPYYDPYSRRLYAVPW
jgi:hypothetical protein